MKSSAPLRHWPSDLADLLDRELRARLADEEDEHGALVQMLLAHALHAPARQFLARPGKRFRARLLESAFLIAGGSSRGCPSELPAALELLHAGSLIIDDIEDGSDERRGAPALHRTVGVPLAINTGNWLYFWPLYLLARAGLPEASLLRAQRRMVTTMLRCHEGQALDLSVKVHRLPRPEVPGAVAATTRLKTGSLLELAAALGALAAGAPRQTVDALARFGRELGCALQMLDDLGGILSDQRRDKGLEDLRLARLTWPWAWLASDLDDLAYGQMRMLLAEVVDDGEPPDLLLTTLREALAHVGRSRVKTRLHAALADLAAAIGASPALEALEAEIQRLEQSYG